jgi:hypothetical protein
MWIENMEIYELVGGCIYIPMQRPMLWFFKYFRQKIQQKLAVLTQNKAKLCKNLINNIGFWEKRQFFRRKLSKIAENCDHNIGPRTIEYVVVLAPADMTGLLTSILTNNIFQ